jgi:hypothetical protein
MAKSIAKPTRTCAVMQHHFALADADPVYRENRRIIEGDTRTARRAERTTVIRIPVVVHVLYHTDRENVEQAQITSQIAALNRDYRLRNEDRSDIPDPFRPFAVDTLVEFGLAVRDPQGRSTTGVTRTRTSKTEFPYDPNDRRATEKLDAMIKFEGFGKTAWPRDSYLNLWTCTINNGLLGYAQFPGGPAATDGVVILNSAFGSGGIAADPFDLGRTAVHEVGHWLNLLHIWGDDRGGCQRSDEVDDTPNQANSNGGDVTRASFPKISCGNAPNGEMFMNYMDYVNDDTMVMFTKGQLKRMNATLSGPRASLSSSLGLTPVPTERIADAAASARSLADVANLAGRDERGERPKFQFDGVDWVPVE